MFKTIDMKTTLMIILFSATLLVSGCVTSHTHAAAWIYKVVDPQMQERDQVLNQLGSEGWILVTADPHGGYVFKRAKKEKPAA